MRYLLSVDLGTASLALAAFGLDPGDAPSDVVYQDIWIFPEPLLPAKKGGVGEPKKAARRAARQARGQFSRKAARLRRVAHLAALIGLRPNEIKPDTGQRIHELRARATTQSIELPDLLRVLLKLVKRRGYSGRFKVKVKKVKAKDRDDADPKEAERGKVESGINVLKDEMKRTRCETLGQYLWHRFRNGETLKLKEVGLYVHREMVEYEFDRIWSEQEKGHPALNRIHEGRPLKKTFREAIFYQRPLRSPAPMVGKCPLEPSLPRAPWAQTAAQEFRIEKQIADLRWGKGRLAVPLSPQQKDILRRLLRQRDSLTFEQAYREFERAACPRPDGRRLNFHRASREDLKGDTTRAALCSLDLFEAWNELDELTKVRVINFLADLGSPEQVDRPDWHAQFRHQDGTPLVLDPAMVNFVNGMVATGKFDRLSKMGFEGGRASYSVKALRTLTALMQEGCDESQAINRAYPEWRKVPVLEPMLPRHALTGNTVVDVALRQVRQRVNRAIHELGGPPTKIIVELSRDMALGLKKRGEIEKQITANQNARKRAKKDLESCNLPATETNILRYLLWEEQDKRFCPYCADPITLQDAFDGNVTNFEHILPRSLTRVRRKRSQLVLAHRRCNDEKGDMTPYERWGGDPSRWRVIEECAEAFKKNRRKAKARLLLLKDWEREVLDDDAISDFADRQLHETSWIAKLVANWVRQICPDVAVSRGQLTAYLRRIWGLDTVIPEIRYAEGLPVIDTEGKEIIRTEFDRFRHYWEGHDARDGNERTDRRVEKRVDHRHHLIDALVIGLTSRGLYQSMARHYKACADRVHAGQPVRLSLSVPPPIPDIRSRALDVVRDCEPRHRPDRYPDSQFFKETAYGLAAPNGAAEAGGSLLTLRTKVSDLADAGNDVEKTRRNLMDITSRTTRESVLQVFERRIAEGKTPREALAEEIRHEGNKTPIKKVRVTQGEASSAQRIEHRSRTAVHVKYLLHNGYAYLELGPRQGKKPQARPVTPLEAVKAKHAPAPPGAIRICKGDTVIDQRDGKRFVVKQIQAAGGGALMLVPVTEAREVKELSSRAGLRKVQGKGLLRLRPFHEPCRNTGS